MNYLNYSNSNIQIVLFGIPYFQKPNIFGILYLNISRKPNIFGIWMNFTIHDNTVVRASSLTEAKSSLVPRITSAARKTFSYTPSPIQTSSSSGVLGDIGDLSESDTEQETPDLIGTLSPSQFVRVVWRPPLSLSSKNN